MKRSEIKGILRDLDFIPSKFRGQSFLLNERIAEKIVYEIEPEMGERILEIGPGLGILTKYLLKQNVVVYGIEIEGKFCHYLKKIYSDIELTNQDFLRIEKFSPFRKIIGNIPYIRTNEILYKILSFQKLPKIVVITLQREVGQKLVSTPNSKKYSTLSVLFQTFFDCEYLFSIPPEEFFPEPEVVSGVIKMRRKTTPEGIKSKKAYIKFVKAIFKQRRKTLRNNLAAAGVNENDIEKILFLNNLNSKIRAESLSPEEVVKLYNDYISQK